MNSPRSILAAGGFLVLVFCLSHTSQGQNPVPAVKPAPPATIRIDDFKAFEVTGRNLSNARAKVNDLRDGKERVLDPATKKVSPLNQEAMNLLAKDFVYALTDKKYYIQPEPAKNELKPIPAELTLESRFEAVDRFILVPSYNRKLNVDQADFIDGFGIAMDSALKEILEATQPIPSIVRVNAARMLSVAARSGAPAHLPMILANLSNSDLDPAILNYSIKAAEGMIAAYNPLLVGDAKYARHKIADADMVKLVAALESIVRRTKPYGPQPKSPIKAAMPKAAAPPPVPDAKAPPMPMVVKGRGDDTKAPPPVGKMEAETVATTPEQQTVIQYFRRSAVRALAQCRFPQYIDPKDGRAVRPLATLAKIAVGDPSITTTPGNDEIAYAIQGLCNLHDFKDVNVDVVFDCIAQGVQNFAGKKAGNKEDKSIPWKVHGANIMSALQDWQKYPNSKRFESRMSSLTTIVVDKVLTPLERIANAGQAPAFEPLMQWREQKPLTDLKLFFEAQEPPIVRGFKVGVGDS